MKTIISRRALVRIVSFSLAIIAVLGAANLIYMKKLAIASRTIEVSYMQAVEDLASSADKISATLTKGLYVTSPEMLAKLSSELISHAETAKNSLNALPVYGQELEKTEKFLTQIGNYAHSLSQNKPSYEDYLRLETLCENAEDFSNSLWALKSKFVASDKRISELFEEIDSDSFILESFTELEDGFAETPTLIYDGPFSDHILNKTPEMTKSAAEITEEEAREKAAPYCQKESYELNSTYQEDGKMPSYVFKCGNATVAVTKQGGFISYMLKPREVNVQKITPDQASEYAKSYLASLGVESVDMTYYETYNNICTINYAHHEGEVTCYTDLIKVAVAMDTGEILGYDGRGFIVNHKERELKNPEKTAEELQGNLSPMLNVVSQKQALIPVNGEEIHCYEFKCKAKNGRTVLVYLNAETGEEEDILILIEMEETTLTV